MTKARRNQEESTAIADLLSRLARGDASALDRIYRRYYQRLLYYGIELVGHDHLPDIKDVVQEIFIWIAKNYERLESIQNFEAYLFQSVRRNILSKLNLDKERDVKFDRFLSRTEALGLRFEPSHEEELIREESKITTNKLLYRELDNLPAYQWEVLYLRYYEGHSYKQIASILSIGVQVARNFAARGIKRLKQQMAWQKFAILLAAGFLN